MENAHTAGKRNIHGVGEDHHNASFFSLWDEFKKGKGKQCFLNNQKIITKFRIYDYFGLQITRIKKRLTATITPKRV
jgi:hypothetical protein